MEPRIPHPANRVSEEIGWRKEKRICLEVGLHVVIKTPEFSGRTVGDEVLVDAVNFFRNLRIPENDAL